jgi:hypothetical protein
MPRVSIITPVHNAMRRCATAFDMPEPEVS